MTGELDALIGSFAGTPEVHHPVRGRIRGAQEFGAFVTELNAWFGRLHLSIEEVDDVAAQRHGFDEVILHVDGATGRIGLPLTRRHATRPPLQQPDLEHASQMSSPMIGTRWPPATSRRSWQRSNPAHTPGSRRVAGTSTVATMAYGVLRAAILEWRRNLAEALRSAGRRGCVRWSGTSCAGARRSCRRGQGSPPTCGVSAASSLRDACAMTSNRPSLEWRRPRSDRPSAGIAGMWFERRNGDLHPCVERQRTEQGVELLLALSAV